MMSTLSHIKKSGKQTTRNLSFFIFLKNSDTFTVKNFQGDRIHKEKKDEDLRFPERPVAQSFLTERLHLSRGERLMKSHVDFAAHRPKPTVS